MKECRIKTEKTDVLVAGSGIVGLSIAYFLSDSGIDVTLWEKDEPGAGASGVNLGQISIIDRDADLELEWVRETLRFYDYFQDELGIDLEWVRTGGLIILKSEEEKKIALELIERQIKRGIKLELLEKNEIRRVEPLFSNETVSGAVYCPEEGRLEPFKVITALVSILQKRGVRIVKRREVDSVSIEDGRIRRVHSRNNSIEAETVVMATGSWTRELAGKAGLNVPVFYHKGMAFVTIPVESCINSVIVSGGFLLKMKSSGQSIGLAVAQHKNGSLIIGQANDNGKAYSRDISYEGISGIAENFLKYFPSLNQLEILRSWAGNTTFSKDGLCSFGYSSRVDNLFIAAGLKGAFSTALGAGKMAAEIICSGREIPGIRELSPDRQFEDY